MHLDKSTCRTASRTVKGALCCSPVFVFLVCKGLNLAAHPTPAQLSSARVAFLHRALWVVLESCYF